jgi:glycosyltransferase involved in cell wall biosynthesis
VRITVITPSKNQGDYIEDCLRSVHSQTHDDIEHIVLDGMSTDRTSELAARFPCKFLQESDSGAAQAINRGFDMATGDIVCWLNADDVFWSNTTLERIVNAFAEWPQVDVITGNGYFIDEHGKLLQPISRRPDRICYRWLTRFDFILQPATFWRRNGLRLDESLKYCFDWKLWIEFWESGLNVLYLPEYFALYRIHSSSLTHQDSARRRGEVYGMAKQYDRRLPQVVWCWIVWKLYAVSEWVHSNILKRFARAADTAVNVLSHGQFGSS